MADYLKPLPIADLDSQPFWARCKAHELSAQRCGDCRKFRWPPQAFCPHCYSWKFDWAKLGETGTVASFVVVHYVSIAAFQEDVPYVVAHITLDGTDHATHQEQASMIRRYIIWRNAHVTDPRLRKVVKRAATIKRAKVA